MLLCLGSMHSPLPTSYCWVTPGQWAYRAILRSPFATACMSGVQPASFLSDTLAPPACTRYLMGVSQSLITA